MAVSGKNSRKSTQARPETSSSNLPPKGASPAKIKPDDIRPNPTNPRLEFPQNALDRLAASITKVGVLVPITVYYDPDVDHKAKYVLLDGERRWRASKQINYAKIPAWVIPKPAGIENVLTMFNIHMLRENWGTLAATLALENVINEIGTDDDKTLQELTGLSRDLIRNMKIVLGFPKKYRDSMLRNDDPVRFNFFVELDKAILSAARKKNPALSINNLNRLTDIFLKKYETGALGDIVDLRRVGDLIKASSQDGEPGYLAKEALNALITDPKMKVLDAYQMGAAAGIEISQVLRTLTGIPQRLHYLKSIDLPQEHRVNLLEGVRRLRDELNEFVETMEAE